MVLLFLGLFSFFLASSVRYSVRTCRMFRALRDTPPDMQAVEECRVAAIRALCSLAFLTLTSLQLVAKGLCGPEWGGLELLWTAVRAAVAFQ